MSKTIFVSGNFNILHPGHLRLLRFARELGDKLIVGVLSDKIGGQGVHVPQELRLEGVRSNSWVSECFLVDEPVTEVIKKIKPDIVVKGKEYDDQINPELDVLKEYGGKLLFSSGEVVFSSVDLIKKDLSLTKERYNFPSNFLKRRNVNLKQMREAIERMSSLKVCVIGDLIVDEFVSCDPLGMSQEDPTIVVTPVDTSRFIGGAGIVAAHASGLGASVDFFSITGKDSTRDFAIETLDKFGVNSFLEIDESRPTTLKRRYRSQGKTLLRVSKLHQGSIGAEIQSKLLKAIENNIKDYDLIIYSDFNYGCLPQDLVDKLTKLGFKRNIFQAADSQSSSQTGDISRFKNMHLLTPTEHEARTSLRNQEDGLVIISENLRKISNAKNIILKLADEGVLLHFFDENIGEPVTDRLPALNSNPVDVAGAGDSMLTATSLALIAGGSFALAAALGSFAAAVQISRVGNQPLNKNDLQNLLKEY